MTSARYGWAHQQVRSRVARLVLSGQAYCTRCGHPIHPLSKWDLDHSDDGTRFLGAAHRKCNRAAGAIKGNGLRRANRAVSRRW